MDIEKKVLEFIGNAADIAASLPDWNIKQGDLTSVFHIVGIETTDGHDHTRSDALIRKAYTYHSSQGNTDTASNIKKVFVNQYGEPLSMPPLSMK